MKYTPTDMCAQSLMCVSVMAFVRKREKADRADAALAFVSLNFYSNSMHTVIYLRLVKKLN